METSRVVALILVECIGVSLLAMNFGNFDVRQGICFMFANLIWQGFCLMPLIDEKKKEEKNENESL
jgi:hypothetical protein